MADEEDARPGTRTPFERGDHGVAEGVVWPHLHGRALAAEEVGRPSAHPIDAGLGVAPAVGVDEAFEVGDERVACVRDVRFERAELVELDAGARLDLGRHRASLARGRLAILRGPCA